LLNKKFEEVPWTLRQTFNGVGFTLIPWIILTSLISLLNANTSAPTSVSPSVDLTNAIANFVFSSVIEGAFLIAPFLYASRLTRFRSPLPATDEASSASRSDSPRRAFEVLGFRRFDFWRTIALIIGLLLVIIIINQLYQYLITVLHLNIQTNDQVIFERSRATPISTYATLLAATFVAPFCEEVFFRSFTLMGFLRGMPVWLAIVLSSLIFGVAHGDPSSFPVLFCIGLALAFVRWYSRSFWPGFILHSLNNGLGALVLILAMHGVNF